MEVTWGRDRVGAGAQVASEMSTVTSLLIAPPARIAHGKRCPGHVLGAGAQCPLSFWSNHHWASGWDGLDWT